MDFALPASHLCEIIGTVFVDLLADLHRTLLHFYRTEARSIWPRDCIALPNHPLRRRCPPTVHAPADYLADPVSSLRRPFTHEAIRRDRANKRCAVADGKQKCYDLSQPFATIPSHPTILFINFHRTGSIRCPPAKGKPLAFQITSLYPEILTVSSDGDQGNVFVPQQLTSRFRRCDFSASTSHLICTV